MMDGGHARDCGDESENDVSSGAQRKWRDDDGGECMREKKGMVVKVTVDSEGIWPGTSRQKRGRLEGRRSDKHG
jgi:hypothetical protein